MLRAIRGATTASANETEAILTAVRELLSEMLAANRLGTDHLVCAFFSATPDLDAVFPARAARELGWTDVALFGMQEQAVHGAPERCLRVMLLVQPAPSTPPGAARSAVQHVYLRGAQTLRPDLAPSAQAPDQGTPEPASVPAHRPPASQPEASGSGPDLLTTSLFGCTFTFYYV